MSSTVLIVGLGNPGPQYAQTRHNIGHMCLDVMAGSAGGRFSSAKRAAAEVIEGRLGLPGQGVRAVLAKTTSFMNVSGGPVSSLAQYYGIDPDHVIVVHDEIDTEFGTVRLKQGGGEGGHNGLRDITRALGTRDYLRLRLGVGRPHRGQDTADHVLSRFSAAERKVLDDLLIDGANAAEHLALHGLLSAQNEFHQREAIRP
ncbi:aminoacyl-tRNA hydrolase [Helcobacillus massiliensis]|uniref:aminoacyl-tRNA hydrolase n=1 Tax=Helcobacillus massiliensis TaxID=521392 RepID=UPI0021A3BC11|nr:aminoacyl-tRNA hydrolase [Helcobacillus massiliensis]MCT1558727.1 aminoacyl-tRNA hydrolase [Helcobacillus massiliensis]MCT2037446.1 aminoacyl-tRNA hydrolase [Helcobacillus massiliensis]MCT2332966.1 aminoacyl-tRNA hydrolase [Helcobacillus massiliensis]